ncbi:MAG: hypothetical protein K2O99_00330 [Lachnospiraceae bacterium]|nr:hypothetical protein [Lachnospiraceae bacterium]
MLLIQNICLQWGKEARGAKGENVRRRFPQAYPIEPQRVQEPVLVQNCRFYQSHQGIRAAIQKEQYLRGRCQYQTFVSVQSVNLTNLLISPGDNALEITFFYDERRSGAPVRRGHNKDYQNPDSPFYARDVRNETAFVLSPGQYGRIVWNERRLDSDGIWYYQLHIYNLYNHTEETTTGALFTKREPDYLYSQLAVLY